MTNWHDPALEAAQGLTVIKLTHFVAGVYIWEFVLNLDYEFSIIMGKRKFTRTVLFYLACRWFTLLALIIDLTNLDTSDANHAISCEAWVILSLTFSHFAYMSASFLIILRIYALWERKRIILVITCAILFADTVAFVYVAAISRAHRNGTICNFDHLVDIRINFITLYITDIVFLSLMLFGVLRWKEARMTDGIWRLMYTQGLIYVAVSTLSYTPSVTFLCLNLNDPMDAIFQVPSLTIMSIGALRMYRGLLDSAALNNPLRGVVGATRPATIRFTPLESREENKRDAEGVVLDPCPIASPERISSIMRQDDGHFGRETA